MEATPVVPTPRVTVPRPGPVITPTIAPRPPVVPVPRVQPPIPVPTPRAQPSIPIPTPRAQPPVMPTAEPAIPRPAVPRVQFPAPEQVGVRITPATPGGILRQFGGGVTTVVTSPQATIAPKVTVATETALSVMMQLMDRWGGTPEQVQQLVALRYADGAELIDPRRRDVIIEIIGMLRNQTFEEVIDFLTDAPGPRFVLWDQKSLDEGRSKVEREISIQQTEEVGTSGVGKCRYCPSTELVFAQRQTRSGDEAMTVYVRCVMCTKQWRQ